MSEKIDWNGDTLKRLVVEVAVMNQRLESVSNSLETFMVAGVHDPQGILKGRKQIAGTKTMPGRRGTRSAGDTESPCVH